MHSASGYAGDAATLRRPLFAGLMAIVMAASCGCIAIPVGTKEVDRKEVERAPRSEVSKVLGTELEASVSTAGMLRGRAYRRVETLCFDEVTFDVTQGKRKILVGLWPYFGTDYYGDRQYDHKPNNTADIFGLVMSPVITPIALFIEFGETWNSQVERFMRAGYVIGWAKTEKKEAMRAVDRQNARSLPDVKAICGATITWRGFGMNGSLCATDSLGVSRLDLVQLPFIGVKDSVLELDLPGQSPPAATIQVRLLPGLVGSQFAQAVWRNPASCEYETVYLDDGTADFSKGRPAAAPHLRASLKMLGQPEDRADVAVVEVSVTNAGRGAAYRLMGRTASSVPDLAGHLMVFGKLEPGQTITRTLELPVTRMDMDGPRQVSIEFKELNGFEPSSLALTVDPRTLRRPVLAFAAEVVDDKARSDKATGNGDGVIQKGESFDLVVTVKNVGQATAREARGVLKLTDSPSLALFDAPEQAIGDLAPGESRALCFNVAVRPWSMLDAVTADVAVSESSFNAQTERQIALPFDAAVPRQPIAFRRDCWVAAEETVLRSGASATAAECARVARGALLHATGELGEWTQVELRTDAGVEKLWAQTAALTAERPAGAGGEPRVVVTRFESPGPSIVFVQPGAAARDTVAESVEVQVTVIEATGQLKNLALLAGPRGAVMTDLTGKTAMESSATGGASESRLMRCRVPLSVGENVVRVTASNERGKSTASELVITRRHGLDEASCAVIVGVQDYLNLGRVPGCREDARAVAEAVRKVRRIKPERVAVLTDEDKGPNFATAGVLEARLERLADAAGEDGLAFFYFSGHGFMRDGEMYLALWDSPGQAGYPLSRVLTALGRSKARAKVAVVDACRANAEVKGVASIAPSALARREDVALFFSCDIGEYSYPAEKDMQSLYTRFLVQVLSEVKEAQEPLTARELQDRIEKLMEACRDTRPQTPRLVPRDSQMVIVPSPSR